MRRAVPILVLATGLLASVGCSISVPTVKVLTGPVTETEVLVPRLAGPEQEAYVTLSFGANKLHLAPGADDVLVRGTVRTNLKDFEPVVRIDGSDIRVEQGQLEVEGVPSLSADSVVNDWDLRLGSDPMRLRITGGAYQGEMDLGGLSLTDLYVSDGASTVEVDFSAPNLAEMGTLRYETGASTVTLTNLGNANFASMVFRSGAGTYELDFGGALRREAQVDIESGLSTLTIIVPETTTAEVEISGGLSSVVARGAWTAGNGGRYRIEGQGPRLLIDLSMGAGTVILETR